MTDVQGQDEYNEALDHMVPEEVGLEGEGEGEGEEGEGEEELPI